jgi:hypothetical protein
MHKYQKTSTFSIDPNVGGRVLKENRLGVQNKHEYIGCSMYKISGLSRAYGLITFFISHLIY